jgi:hypothetical protein
MTFPRADVVARLNGNVDTLIDTMSGGAVARKLFLAEVWSDKTSGDASPVLNLLFPEVKLAATIERSLNTALGRGFDHMLADIARAAHGNGESRRQYVTGTIPAFTASQIDSIVEGYKDKTARRRPDTPAELAAILPGISSGGARESVNEKNDLFFVDSDGVENHVEIKTAKPNYDQGLRAKRRILRIHAVKHPTTVKAYVAIIANPNGRMGRYRWPVSPIFFDLQHDVMVGEHFWNHVGNSPATYDNFLDCLLEVRARRRKDLLALLSEV